MPPLTRHRLRGADDWLLYAESLAPEDDRCYTASTEVWPEWAALPRGADERPGAVWRHMRRHAIDDDFARYHYQRGRLVGVHPDASNRCPDCGLWPRYLDAGTTLDVICNCTGDSPLVQAALDYYLDELASGRCRPHPDDPSLKGVTGPHVHVQVLPIHQRQQSR